MNDDERRILSHALGLARGRRAYRNHYAAPAAGGSYTTIRSLVYRGLMVEGHRSADGKWSYYHVTEAGRAAIGAPEYDR
jgi:hypothetical protein